MFFLVLPNRNTLGHQANFLCKKDPRDNVQLTNLLNVIINPKFKTVIKSFEF